MIKAEVKVSFGKGEFEIAQEFLRFIRGFNQKAISPEYKESIHWQTLRAWPKNKLESAPALRRNMSEPFSAGPPSLKLQKKGTTLNGDKKETAGATRNQRSALPGR